jgi:ketosteroid isomerase-like protein
MAQGSEPVDLVALTRRAVQSMSDGDFEALDRYYAPHAVWDVSRNGFGIFEGLEAIRKLHEEWFSVYEHWRLVAEEVLDLGCGVVFVVLHQRAHLRDSSGEVQMRQAAVASFRDGLVVRLTMYQDIEEARADARRAAEAAA